MTDRPVIAMKDIAELGALREAVEASASPGAMKGLLLLLNESNAGLMLASAVASMITDLFGGSDPRKVAEAARGALAVYSVTKHQGPGADLLKHAEPS